MPLSDIGNNSALQKRTDQFKPIKIQFDGSNTNRESKHLYTSGQSKNVVVLKPRREIVIDELQKEFDNQLDKIALINDFMALHCERDKIKGDIKDLKNRTVEMKMFLNDAREKIEIFKTVQMPQTQSLIDGMRQQHLKMLNMMDALDHSEKDGRSTSFQSLDSDNNASPMVETPKIQNRQTFVIAGRMNTITPKRHQSPFVLRVNPASLCKLNRQFEIDIDRSEFDKIPKYLKGRDSIDELSTFLETIIVKCFIDKYTLLHRDRENVQPTQMQRWKMYRSQMEYFPGEMFITEGDVSFLLGRMLDKKMSARIAMLRHLHIIQDLRHKSTTCYIWRGKK